MVPIEIAADLLSVLLDRITSAALDLTADLAHLAHADPAAFAAQGV